MEDNSSQFPAGTQAIGRALMILRLLADKASELNAASIAEELDLSPGTTSRILRALHMDGLLAVNPANGAYFLGNGAVLLGQAAQRVFGLDRALPLLEQVNADTEESVNMAIRQGRESVVMLRVQSTLPLRFEQHPGARFPLYTTASGKAILAFADDRDEYVSSLPEQLPELTSGTLRTPQSLAEQLDQTRDRGYSIDEEENVAGVRCVGAPVFDAGMRAQAALVIQVPTVRMPPERVDPLGKEAMRVAKEVARLVPVHRPLSL